MFGKRKSPNDLRFRAETADFRRFSELARHLQLSWHRRMSGTKH
jgi:hypothetical protein